jgi:hypothetical protein
MDGVLYCKTHFEQLFKETGTFSKNFQGNTTTTMLIRMFVKKARKKSRSFSDPFCSAVQEVHLQTRATRLIQSDELIIQMRSQVLKSFIHCFHLIVKYSYSRNRLIFLSAGKSSQQTVICILWNSR